MGAIKAISDIHRKEGCHEIFLCIFLLSVILVFQGCAPQAAYKKFSMLKPIPNSTMYYSDDKIKIIFEIRKSWLKNLEDGYKQYDRYRGVAFTLENKTDEILTIDWNKISFEDYRGSSGHPVMHEGIKFTDCAKEKLATTIPPKGRIDDIIIPCYAVSFDGEWVISIFPSPRKFPKIKFGLFMPLKFGQKVKNYQFTFEAE